MLCLNCFYSLTLKIKLFCSLFFSPQLIFLSLLPSPITIPLNPFSSFSLSFKNHIPYSLLLYFCKSPFPFLLNSSFSFSFATSLFLLFSLLFSLPVSLDFIIPLFSVPFFPEFFLPLFLLVLPGSFLNLNVRFSISLLLSVIFLFASPLMRWRH